MSSGSLRAALQFGVLALLVLAPLPFGSVRSGAVLSIELAAAFLGLGAILLIGSDDDARAAVPVAPLLICGGLIALGVFQLVPLPFSIAERFNPTAELVRPLIPYLGGNGPPSVSWSVSSPETMDALLRFVAYVLIGLATAVAFDTNRARRRFAFVLVAAAVFQAVYGSGEYLTGRQHIFSYAKKYYLDSATGTLINRNHFATMLAIALPFALTLAIPRGNERRERSWRESVVALSRGPALLRLFAVAASALLWMGLLLSHSRAGLLSALAGAAIVVFRYRGTKAARWTAAVGGAVVLVLLTLELSQAPGERFFAVKDDLDAKAGRIAVWRDSRALIAARPIAGWGFGTFESAFPTVQSADIDVHYDHAHNDWLEWATDGGLLGLSGAVGLLALALRRGDTATRAALAAVGLHAMWDFSLRIPSVAATAAAAMGLGYAAYAAATTSRAETSAFPAPPASDAGPVPRRFGRWIVPIVLLTCASPIGAATGGAATGLGGWIVPWDFPAGMQSAARGRGSYDEVLLFAARFDPAGRIALPDPQGRWPDAVRKAREAGLRVWLTVVNDRAASGSTGAVLKDSDLVHELIGSPERCAAHRKDILEIATGLGVDGVDLDYENLPATEREPFTAFVRALAGELRAHGLALSVTVQPKTGASTSRGPGAMDWSGLCAAADRVQVMLYNEHNASTGPGAIAGLDWVRRVADYGLTQCASKSLVPVLKVSGMDWGPARSDWLSFKEVSSLIARVRPKRHRERIDRVPWLTYRGDDGRHVVYFEDAQSLGAKSDLLRARGFTRIVLWSLGSEDPETPARLRPQNR